MGSTEEKKKKYRGRGPRGMLKKNKIRSPDTTKNIGTGRKSACTQKRKRRKRGG